MTLEMTLAFAGAFCILAVSPGPGLAAILSRSLGGGYVSGLAVTSGLVVGHAIFLAIAMTGLSAISGAVGSLFQIVKYATAAYLIWRGMNAFRTAKAPLSITAAGSRGLASDLGLGFAVNLGNPMPIIFYGALLPTFLDLSRSSVLEYGVLMGVIAVVSFLVYGAYMVVTYRAGRLLVSRGAARRLDQAMGLLLMCSGLLVASA